MCTQSTVEMVRFQGLSPLIALIALGAFFHRTPRSAHLGNPQSCDRLALFLGRSVRRVVSQEWPEYAVKADISQRRATRACGGGGGVHFGNGPNTVSESTVSNTELPRTSKIRKKLSGDYFFCLTVLFFHTKLVW